ncbi:MAG: alkaline phosphatase family protein [Phycisphaerales bacterium]
MRRTAVILVVGLTESLLAHAPRLRALAGSHATRLLRPPLPAVTCTAQASMLTGQPVAQHGIVANGWYDRSLAEVQFWKQSNRLVQREKVWHEARRRDPSFTCANLFWWYNMYADVDLAVTPRPIYKADGRKIPDIHTHPADLRDRLNAELGPFPLFKFWGPLAGIESTRWITDAATRLEQWHSPTLSLVYLPHLDYPLQRLGPDHPDVPNEVIAVDREVGRLLDLYESRGVQPIVVSEYGIEPVDTPVHINRALLHAGLLRVRVEDGLELLDAGASEREGAFAVADHQVAHVYASDPGRLEDVARVCGAVPGVERVLSRDDMRARGLAHERCGDLLLVARQGAWFTYYYWLDDARAPDFARTVDIHRKPGYDPVELFRRSDVSTLGVMRRLAMRKVGLRTLLDVIPLDASLVQGSHGRTDVARGHLPLLIAPGRLLDAISPSAEFPCESVRDLILGSLFA